MSNGQPRVSAARWIKLLQDNEDEAKSGLGEHQAAAFDTELHQLIDDLTNNPDRSDEPDMQFIQLVERYEPVDQWLQRKDARFKAVRTSPHNTEAMPAPPPGAAAGVGDAAPVAAEPRYGTPDVGPGQDRTRTAAPLTSSPQQPGPDAQRRRGRSGKVAKTNGKQPWTPELKMQFFKEIITALLGLVIIGFTLWFALRSFNLVGNTKKLGDAKDLLTILLGLAGVVVGYYFGRVPADARAAHATTRADTAVRQREQVKAQARSAAGQLDNILADGTRATTRGEVPAASLAGLRSVRDELHDLGAPAE